MGPNLELLLVPEDFNLVLEVFPTHKKSYPRIEPRGPILGSEIKFLILPAAGYSAPCDRTCVLLCVAFREPHVICSFC